MSDDAYDKIGTEPEAGEWWLVGYIVFCAAVVFSMGFLFGWYLG